MSTVRGRVPAFRSKSTFTTSAGFSRQKPFSGLAIGKHRHIVMERLWRRSFNRKLSHRGKSAFDACLQVKDK